MSKPDLNLLYTLEAILSECSVARAAKRMGLSPSAMSRAVARLREVTGDPLLVRAGRGLVPTPRALELRDIVSQRLMDVEQLLQPAQLPDMTTVERLFTIRASDGFAETFAPALLDRIAHEAPLIRLRFTQKLDRESTYLRDGTVDLETGVIATVTSPEIRIQSLFVDRFVGVVRKGHGLSKGTVSVTDYIEAQHVHFSRRGMAAGPIEQTLSAIGKGRSCALTVGGFAAALSVANNTDLVATVPERHTASLRKDMASFELPFDVPTFTVSMMWHPRMDADPAHRWLRNCIRTICS